MLSKKIKLTYQQVTFDTDDLADYEPFALLDEEDEEEEDEDEQEKELEIDDQEDDQ